MTVLFPADFNLENTHSGFFLETTTEAATAFTRLMLLQMCPRGGELPVQRPAEDTVP